MKRLIQMVGITVALSLLLAVPAQAGVPRTVIWRCDVPNIGLVDFVTAAQAARHGINTANDHAGQVFRDKFGEVCTVL